MNFYLLFLLGFFIIVIGYLLIYISDIAKEKQDFLKRIKALEANALDINGNTTHSENSAHDKKS